MSDTTTCSNCGTEVPAAAAFCTGCGQSLRSAASPPPPPAPPADATRVDTPGLNDATQVAPPPPPPSTPAPSPFAAPAPPASTSSGPWGPSSSAAPPAPPAGPPTSAPWSPPTSTPPPANPSWQQPATPPPGAATFTPATPPPPGAPPSAAWGAQGGPGGNPAWGAQPVETSTKAKGSVLGGVVGIVGAVLAVFGIFSGWVKLGNTGTVTAWSLTAGEGLLKTQTPYAILALAGFAGAASILLLTGLARTPVRIITALLGVAIIGVTAANWAEIASFVTDNFPSSFEATTAIGFYLTIAGGVLVIIAALLPAKKS